MALYALLYEAEGAARQALSLHKSKLVLNFAKNGAEFNGMSAYKTNRLLHYRSQ